VDATRVSVREDRVRYQAHLEREMNEAKVEHWYMALLASILYCLPWRVWGQDVPDKADLPSTFLLKFGDPEEMKKKEEVMSEEDSIRYAELQKSIWLGIFGFDDQGKPVGNEPIKTRMPKSMMAENKATEQSVVTLPQTPAPTTPPSAAAPKRRRTQVFINGHRADRSPAGG
jgi:hypothetical protein